jgi:hypothetical protein
MVFWKDSILVSLKASPKKSKIGNGFLKNKILPSRGVNSE